jgi:hypothetical protein
MIKAILESGPGNFQIVKDGKLYTRRADDSGAVVDEMFRGGDVDIDLHVQAAVYKWGCNRVVDDAGNTGVIIGDDEIPKTKWAQLPTGETVAVLDK